MDALFDGFQEGIWRGVVNAAEASDVNLLCYLTGYLWHQEEGKTVRDLIGRDRLDGLAILAGSLGSLVSQERMAQLFGALPQIPTVSISKLVPGLPSLLADNQTGFRQLFSHLVNCHDCRRIAFIRGPATNHEAEERYKVYLEALDSFGLPFEPAMVFQGGFDRDSGLAAVRAFLDERKVEFDAVVGANDYMALFAMKELQNRGFGIPDDVVVAGFDDVREAAGAVPRLTTVGQPLNDIGAESVLLLLAMIRGETVPESTFLPTTLVIGRSCGCTLPLSNEPLSIGGEATGGEAPSSMADLDLAASIEAPFPALGERLDLHSWAKDLSDALLDEAAGTRPGRVVGLLETFVARGLQHHVRANEWYAVLTNAFQIARRSSGAAEKERLSHSLEASLLLVARLAEAVQIAKHAKSKEELTILPRIFAIAQMDQEEIKRDILHDLPAVGIPSFFLFRYTDDTQERASLVVHYDFSSHVILERPAEPFIANQLVPGDFREDRRHGYMVLPIRSGSRESGFALCEMGDVDPATYGVLVNQLSVALRVTSLMEEVCRHATDLEIKVEERTRELKEAQKQLIETAHQAGMAEIAVGLMHNLGNLLNSVNISAEEIQAVAKSSKIDGLGKANDLFRSHADDLVQFFTDDPRAKLLPEYYAKITDSLKGERFHIQGEVNELLTRTSLIRETVRTLQEYARGGGNTFLRETVDLPLLIESVLKIHEVHLSRHRVEVRRSFLPIAPLVTQRAMIVHILINVIKNAVDAMQHTPENERFLTIAVHPYSDGAALVQVSDTGEGIAPPNLDKLFSYGFTTKVDGHGFGLHTCANYVKQLNGSISVESAGEGQGATFSMVFRSNA